MRAIYYSICIVLAFIAISSFAEPDNSTKELKVYPVPEKGCMETTKKRCDEAKNMYDEFTPLPNYCKSNGDCYKGRTCKDFFCTGDLKCVVACSDHLTRICDESKNNEGPYTCRTSTDCFNGRVCYKCDYNCEDYEMGQQCNYPEVGQCGNYPDGEYGPCKIEW